MSLAEGAAGPALTERRRRPRDRKAQIARVSAEAFSELGYHGVSMEDIAGRVGVTAASLYRHYSGKYELFRAAVLNLGQQLVDCTAFLDDGEGEDWEDGERGDVDHARLLWDRAVAALIDTTLANRTSGGLYRWEGRFLDAGDQLVLNEQLKLVNRRLHRPLTVVRPGLESPSRWIISATVLSVIGSITNHHAQLPTDRIHATLAAIACDVRDTDLPDTPPSGSQGLMRLTVGPDAGEYERILHEAMMMFDERGYRETAMDDIAAAAELSTTGIYRYFSGKASILATAYRRAADRVSGDLSTALAAAADPRHAVELLADGYVRRSVANPELAYVYYAERANVPGDDQIALRNIQRATVDAWARQVARANGDAPLSEARFAVHAGFGLVADLARFMPHTDSAATAAVLRHLMLTTLLGGARGAPGRPSCSQA